MIVDVIKNVSVVFTNGYKNITISLRVLCDPGNANDDTETQLTKIHIV